tara:strand:- start:4149 stop:5198 length:1050 start_codon:yes stop_codon:yes gene_type:complete
MTVEILDCTIRDGGYLNNWRFSDEQVINCFKAGSESGFDYMELGFRSSKKKFSDKKYGKWLFCSEEDLVMVRNSVKNGSKISIMVRPENVEIENFIKSQNSVIDMIRVLITDPSHIEKACKYANQLKFLGYTIGLNPIRIDSYSENEIKQYFSTISKFNPEVDYFFIADTYGSIDLSKISKLIEIYNDNFSSKQNNKVKLGFHGHNNLQDAILKANSAMKMGFGILDSCMFGLGRGPGNLCSELLVGELQKINSKKYCVLPLLRFIDQFIHSYKDNTDNLLDCRYNLIYVMTGLLTIHPDYGEYILKTEITYPIDKIWDVFNNLVECKKNRTFHKQYFEDKLKTGVIGS